ncbi:MAG: hypothetical protein ACYTBJ_00400 [Planctomycetota bacterium]
MNSPLPYTGRMRNTPTLNSALTWWAESYQPELLKMRCGDWNDLLDHLYDQDVYEVLKLLEGHGWKPNGWLLICLVCASNGETVNEYVERHGLHDYLAGPSYIQRRDGA